MTIVAFKALLQAAKEAGIEIPAQLLAVDKDGDISLVKDFGARKVGTMQKRFFAFWTKHNGEDVESWAPYPKKEELIHTGNGVVEMKIWAGLRKLTYDFSKVPGWESLLHKNLQK